MNFTALGIKDLDEFNIAIAFAPWILDDYWQVFVSTITNVPLFIFILSLTMEFTLKRKEFVNKHILVFRWGIDYT